MVRREERFATFSLEKKTETPQGKERKKKKKTQYPSTFLKIQFVFLPSLCLSFAVSASRKENKLIELVSRPLIIK